MENQGSSQTPELTAVSVELKMKPKEEEEDVTINEEELLELGNCHQKEDLTDVKLGSELTDSQREEATTLLEKHRELFSVVPGKAEVIKHKICITDCEPIRSKPYPLPYAVRENLK